MVFKRNYYTTIRPAITLMYLGLLGFFTIFAWLMIDRMSMGAPLNFKTVVLILSAILFDTGMVWALWRNKI